MRTPILVDTDISLGTPNAEIDDGAALMLLANSPQVDVRAVTSVHGNAPVEIATANLLRFMALLGRPDIPIGAGAAAPLRPDPQWGAFLSEWQSQYGPTPPTDRPVPSFHGPDLIIETAKACPGELVIVALGPLTNLALALERYPPLARLVRSVYAMGGSLEAADQAEFNIRCDPEAAQAVFQAGWPLYLHGLEITRRALFSPEDFASLDPEKPAQALLQRQADGWIRIVEAQGWETGGCSLHDAVAAAAVVAPSLFRYASTGLDVNTGNGGHRGATRAVTGGAPSRTQIAVDLDARACRTFILEKIRE